MKTEIKGLIAASGHWLEVQLKQAPARERSELPLRAELFTADQMERHGKVLAQSHTLAKKSTADLLLGRLADNEETLQKACQVLTTTSSENNRITPAGEWLLDNFYLIEDQIRTTKRHLPKGYEKKLPRLGKGLSRDYPRVYDIALQTIAHGDGRWDAESLRRFVAAYQSVTTLTLGELWAIPIMLRLALIENLRRVGAQIAADRIDRNLADEWGDRMVAVAETDPKSLVLVIADMARSGSPMIGAFVAELARRLQGHGAALVLPLTWIEQRLAEDGLTINLLIQTENQQQAASQVSVSNSIASLRRLGEVDWREFVEVMSAVEQTLRMDPAEAYVQMDFATRDRYRHVVERLAQVSQRTESDVAAAAINLASLHAHQEKSASAVVAANPDQLRRNHVGFYLIGAGLADLKQTIKAKPTPAEKLTHLYRRYPLPCYLGLAALITFGLTAQILLTVGQAGVGPGWLVVLGLVTLFAASQLALPLVNWVATLSITPHPLPRMDFSKGIPAEFRTLVVVPAMLSTLDSVDRLIEALEVRFLGNRDNYLHFALLTDYNDADSEHLPADQPMLALAQERIDALNRQYPAAQGDNFFLLHRPRLWNPAERKWMGYERKRGKLAALNALLRGRQGQLFSLIVGRTEVLTEVKYVITLDSDTLLARESARQLVGAMAHPLNHPVVDASRRCVVDGYGILQPRIAEVMPSAGPTHYARLYGNEPGIDPYTRTVSDVYQDMFGEGSFIGKGIYDVDAFEQTLDQRFPENRILSHDLLEGCYARSGLLSDVLLFEQSPGSYLADSERRIRWMRGDWQLAGWLRKRVRVSGQERAANPLTLLAQWKLFDNLRRSLIPVALLALLVLDWLILPSNTHIGWLMFAILIFPSLASTLPELLCKPADVALRQHLWVCTRQAHWRLSHVLVQLACLPYEAVNSLSAILRTLWRLHVSRRNLLEWRPSEQSRTGPEMPVSLWFARLWPGSMTALALFLALAFTPAAPLLAATPVLLLWLASPWLAWWLSRPLQSRVSPLELEQTVFLRITARKTWGFFERFVGPLDNWLPPDNFQEQPAEILAHRTSPTNMGMALLANLTAFDFGYLSMGQLLERSANTLQSMNTLTRFRGHFYNWYDTQTLQPLNPQYISTVDSGNLAGHLLTLRQGLLELIDAPLLARRSLDGLHDTAAILNETFGESAHRAAKAPLKHFNQLLDQYGKAMADNAIGFNQIDSLCSVAKQISDAVVAAETELPRLWCEKLLMQCQAWRDDFSLLSPSRERHNLRTIAALEQPAVKTAWPPLAGGQASLRMAEIERLANLAFALAQMESRFLYDPANHLMTIGFNVNEQRSDRSNYDLLSSEARLAVFVAIAQGQVPQESWFSLGRLLTVSGGEPILVSWSGSMFEYLMPLLVMPSYPNTLLDQTCRAAVRRQIEYGKERGVAWGISESGFSTVDAQLNYQYRAFGVPGLGLKRGLAEDLVIAPYASAMALMLAPAAACSNLQHLVRLGASGEFGFYEAIDYTPSRLPRGQSSSLVRSYMAHHQGMSFLAISSLLHGQPMQRRFAAEPLFRATLLLLQERIPKAGTTHSLIPQTTSPSAVVSQNESSIRVFEKPDTPTPEIQLLSNGRYHLMLTQSGGGYSRWRDLAVTRWREDATCDQWGLFGYLRDLASGVYWSTSYQPTAGHVTAYKAVFSEGHVEYNRRDSEIDTYTEVVVSPEDDIELRRVRLRNLSRVRRTIEFTSYGEVVLAPLAADEAHPTFSNLFVETELLPEKNAILATRRPRAQNERPPWLCHVLTVHKDESCNVSFETDRDRFIGRGRTLAAPSAMVMPGALSNTSGAVLDPIIAIRCQMTLEPGASATLDLVTGVTESREQCITLIEKYRDYRLTNRVFGLAWTHSQVLLRQLNLSEADAQLYCQLASAVVFASSQYRAHPSIIASNRRGQTGLWGYSISGDLPIVLLHIEDAANMPLVRQLIQAHNYWRQKGLAVDLVILNEERSSYRQVVQDQVISLMPSDTVMNTNDRAGGVFVRAAEQMPAEDRILLQSVARVVLFDKRGSLSEQLLRRQTLRPYAPKLIISTTPRHRNHMAPHAPSTALEFFNGLGGFAEHGTEYVIRLNGNDTTPAPWVNVLANRNFGSVVSESGQAYTWIDNAHEFRLTPWNNDPVQDATGEAFYLRDNDSGVFWSPTALPRRGHGTYETRHGFGYSVFSHAQDGIHSELWVYVAADAAVKFSVLKIHNTSQRQRHLSAIGYVEWVLGDTRSKTALHVVTELGLSMGAPGALLARNRYNTDFGERTAFFDASTSRLEPATRTLTADRTEFLGRNGSRQQPAALKRSGLSGRVGAGLDPCAAIQFSFALAEGQVREIVFTLGAGQDGAEAVALAQRFHGTVAAQEALAAVRDHWRHTLGRVQVATPDPALNLLANGWLLYQTISSRLWGRSGFYQSGGAFGFRDQLQDTLALVHNDPHSLRAQLLLCAAHQFVEGDVQHWWHPPQGRGVRTRCSDDFLWLPFALCRYVETSGDRGVLDETVGFLHGRLPNVGEESYYDEPKLGHEQATLYEHAVRAIRHGLTFGSHGLPLIGSGDWNDGMNLVGEHGRGESVWLGFFLYRVLQQFAPLARERGDAEFAELCQTEARRLQENIEQHGWDGKWYRRAYYDDGTPLGSASNAECRIDVLAQSWAVLSGAATAQRGQQGMKAVSNYLVKPDERLIQLLAPPFDKTPMNPGYIKGYVPGVRENGGQFTHAAVWAVMAFAELGDHKQAWALFDMINPINHGLTRAEAQLYKLESYVTASDIYSVPPHVGRGGWSWYTGSAGWMYQLITESLLGVHLEAGQRLRLSPCLPAAWDGYSLAYRYLETDYQIEVKQASSGKAGITLDDQMLDQETIPLVNDRLSHRLCVKLLRRS